MWFIVFIALALGLWADNIWFEGLELHKRDTVSTFGTRFSSQGLVESISQIDSTCGL